MKLKRGSRCLRWVKTYRSGDGQRAAGVPPKAASLAATPYIETASFAPRAGRDTAGAPLKAAEPYRRI